jgi:hypothetical protein
LIPKRDFLVFPSLCFFKCNSYRYNVFLGDNQLTSVPEELGGADKANAVDP